MADENIPQINSRQIARDPELERARAWWQNHGRSIVVGVAIGLAAVVGFNYWQSYQATQAENASVLFERLKVVLESAAEAEVETETEPETETADADETNNDTETETNTAASIHSIADELMSEYGATPYAAHGAFALAKFSVENDDLDRATEALRWVIDNVDDDAVLHIARLRLAAVLLSMDEADEVVTLLEVENTAGFAARYHELVGDAYQQKNNTANARSAYQDSMAALVPGTAERALLKLKLDDLGE